MDISKWAFQNRNLIYFFVTVLLFGGAYSCYEMSKLEDPEIKVKLAMVVTTYPGASDRKSTRLNSSHVKRSRMPSSA